MWKKITKSTSWSCCGWKSLERIVETSRLLWPNGKYQCFTNLEFPFPFSLPCLRAWSLQVTDQTKSETYSGSLFGNPTVCKRVAPRNRHHSLLHKKLVDHLQKISVDTDSDTPKLTVIARPPWTSKRWRPGCFGEWSQRLEINTKMLSRFKKIEWVPLFRFKFVCPQFRFAPYSNKTCLPLKKHQKLMQANPMKTPTLRRGHLEFPEIKGTGLPSKNATFFLSFFFWSGWCEVAKL